MTELKRGRLFCYATLEPKDELDEQFEKCYRELSSLITRLRENELYNHLNDKVGRSPQDHEEVMMALLYTILTEPSHASKSYNTLNLVSRDSLSMVTTHTENIIMSKMTTLQDTARVQTLWLTREMVKTGVGGADKLCFALLKQLPAGNTEACDIYIAETLMNILLDNREWVDAQPGLVSSSVYTYLSLLPCHFSPSLSNLREQEAEMCVSFIRTRYVECAQIGRDLLRLLQSVSRIQCVTELWRDLSLHPQKIGQPYTGIQQLLLRRTSRRFIAGRIVVDAEIKLNFLLSKVKFTQRKRYLEWFQKKYLATPESLHLVPELIRFVCCVIHPTNEVLASDVIPRWAVIGWLLSLCQSNPVVCSSAKLALFYDWLAYNQENDNIMNIEPAILLMQHSLRGHPHITATLLDFLCRMVTEYSPSHQQFIENGVKAALKDVLQKGVILSLDPLFESSQLHEDLRLLVRETFPEFCHTDTPPTSMEVLEVGGGVSGSEVGGADQGEGVVLSWGQVGGSSEDDPLVISADDEELEGEDAEVITAFSDPEDGEDEHTEKKSSLGSFGPSPEFSSDSQGFVALSFKSEDSKDSTSCDPWARLDELPEELRDKMLALRKETSHVDTQTTLLEDILKLLDKAVNENEENRESIVGGVATPLSSYLSEEFDQDCENQDDAMGEVPEKKLHHTIFRCMSPGSSSSSPPLSSTVTSLAISLHHHQPKLGYFYLDYLSKSEGNKLPLYKEFSDGFTELSFKECLLRDLKECVENEPTVFYSLLPHLSKQLPQEVVGWTQMLCLIVSNIDPPQLHHLVHSLMMKEFQLFGRQPSTVQDIISNSLQWDSFDQFCVWQLLNAEGPDPSAVLTALSELDPEEHHEALSGALLFLKNESSGYAAIGSLLSLPLQLSSIVDAIGSRWLGGRPTKCAKLLSQHLDNIEKATEKDSSPDFDPILDHLQRLVIVLNSRQVLEAAETILSKTLTRLFKTYSHLPSVYSDLFKAITAATSVETSTSTKKESAGHKRSNQGSSEKTTSKHEPKPKKRRVTNRDEVIDS